LTVRAFSDFESMSPLSQLRVLESRNSNALSSTTIYYTPSRSRLVCILASTRVCIIRILTHSYPESACHKSSCPMRSMPYDELMCQKKKKKLDSAGLGDIMSTFQKLDAGG